MPFRCRVGWYLQDLKLGFPSFQDASAISALANITSLTSLQIIFMGIEGFHGIGALQDAFAHMCSGLSGAHRLLRLAGQCYDGTCSRATDSLGVSLLAALQRFELEECSDFRTDRAYC